MIPRGVMILMILEGWMIHDTGIRWGEMGHEADGNIPFGNQAEVVFIVLEANGDDVILGGDDLGPVEGGGLGVHGEDGFGRSKVGFGVQDFLGFPR